MIRQIQADDIGECVNVIKTSFLTIAETFGFTEKDAPRYVSFYISNEKLERHYSEHRPMFAYYSEKTGKILGYYSLKYLPDGACDLKHLCVLPGYRNYGIGKTLVWHAVKTAQQNGFKKMKISLIYENTPVREWYERRGAQFIGRQKFDFFPFTVGYFELDLTKTEIKKPQQKITL